MDVWKAYKAPELLRLRHDVTRPASGLAGAAVTDTSTRVAISKPADLLQKLSTLKQSDATKFRHLMGELGSNLKAAANPQSGAVGDELKQLADQLLRVAKTGDLASLAPTPSGPDNAATLSSNRSPRSATRTVSNKASAPAASAASSQGSVPLAATGQPLFGAHAAIEAYKRNAPSAARPTAAVTQALDYVLSAVSEANQ